MQEQRVSLTKRDLVTTCLRILFGHRVSQSMEFFYGTGVCAGMVPVLRRLYGDRPEEYKAALHRHLAPYISEMTWGNCILGAACAMEEQRANGMESITPESINAVKTGLMGPFAGLGDTLNYFIMAPIITAIFISIAMNGSPLGAFASFIVMGITQTIGIVTFNMGYKLGRESLLDILRGGWVDRVMTGAGVLGMLMMGALSANYVSLSSNLTFTISGREFAVQGFFDQIVPGFLPLVLLICGYVYLNRPGANNGKLMLALTAVGLIGSVIGLFG